MVTGWQAHQIITLVIFETLDLVPKNSVWKVKFQYWRYQVRLLEIVELRMFDQLDIQDFTQFTKIIELWKLSWTLKSIRDLFSLTMRICKWRFAFNIRLCKVLHEWFGIQTNFRPVYVCAYECKFGTERESKIKTPIFTNATQLNHLIYLNWSNL